MRVRFDDQIYLSNTLEFAYQLDLPDSGSDSPNVVLHYFFVIQPGDIIIESGHFATKDSNG